ncbi:hypothetical protein ACFSUD_15390 [Sulfitobacter aestuarii]|uniref:Uncharacterized protein n=1 Tax=Sulfitobacter aestuarii TaxID=2161676 RepID=A0ABW5U590_9RHOB
MQKIAAIVHVEAGFVPIELALEQDILRMADRLRRKLRFSVRICTLSGQELGEGLGEVFVRAGPIAAEGAGQPRSENDILHLRQVIWRPRRCPTVTQSLPTCSTCACPEVAP